MERLPTEIVADRPDPRVGEVGKHLRESVAIERRIDIGDNDDVFTANGQCEIDAGALAAAVLESQQRVDLSLAL